MAQVVGRSGLMNSSKKAATFEGFTTGLLDKTIDLCVWIVGFAELSAH